jgi:CRP/FNR family cyclic AMP-dependent transcriptional regulator
MLARVRNAPIALIWRIWLFSDLNKSELRAVTEKMPDEMFEAGSVVVEEGTPAHSFFVINSGRAKVTIGGREVSRLGPGDHFGEIALIAESPRTATVTAELNLRTHSMTRSDFRVIVESNPSIAWKLLQTLARRLIDAEQRD